VRHAIRVSRETAVWFICWAKNAVLSSKSRVYREPALAHGTRSPHVKRQRRSTKRPSESPGAGDSAA
jgi:hypothetical protein